MNTGAVTMVVHAHDARNAVPRLTLPVSERCCRARILARQQRSQPGCMAPGHDDKLRAAAAETRSARGQLLARLRLSSSPSPSQRPGHANPAVTDGAVTS